MQDKVVISKEVQTTLSSDLLQYWCHQSPTGDGLTWVK